MSCWVVPSVAAELWGVAVHQILEGVQGGTIPSKEEAGFTFVDVAPNSPKFDAPKPLRPPTPATYSVVTPEETEALIGEPEGDMGDWREARTQNGQLRRRPLAA